MKTNNKLTMIFILFCLLYFFVSGNAQYAVQNSAFSNGATVSTDSINHGLISIAGQKFIGESNDNSYFAYSGFIYSGLPIYTGMDDFLTDGLPKTFELYQNYPNPFNPTTNIKFSLPKMATVKIDVFNVIGQHIITLINTKKEAGYHVINFDAHHFASGMYFYTITADNFHNVKRMLLIK